MADYFVASGGSNTAPYDTWAKAATSFQTALTAATADGDRVIIQYNAVPSGDAELASDTTYTIGGNVQIIAASNDGGSAFTATAMGTANWIGNSSSSRSITMAGAFSVFIYGLTLRIASNLTDSMTLVTTTIANYTYRDCYFWQGNTNGGSLILIGATAGTSRHHARFQECTFRFGATGQGIRFSAGTYILEGCTLSSDGSTPTTLFPSTDTVATVIFDGCDLSLVTGTLIPNQTGGTRQFYFRQCKLGAAVTVMASQTTAPNLSSVEAYVIDSASGDEHFHFQHYNALGTLTSDTSIYANAGAAYTTGGSRYSFKVVTTANASRANPYVSPWITVHHEGTSAITPNIECVRSGSSTAYTNAEVWSEWMVKSTSGSTRGTFVRTDRVAVGGTAANQTTGALGASDWTGESGTSWFGKLDPTSSFTPAELGDLCGRVVVGAASATVYYDPTLRGRS